MRLIRNSYNEMKDDACKRGKRFGEKLLGSSLPKLDERDSTKASPHSNWEQKFQLGTAADQNIEKERDFLYEDIDFKLSTFCIHFL